MVSRLHSAVGGALLLILGACERPVSPELPDDFFSAAATNGGRRDAGPSTAALADASPASTPSLAATQKADASPPPTQTEPIGRADTAALAQPAPPSAPLATPPPRPPTPNGPTPAADAPAPSPSVQHTYLDASKLSDSDREIAQAAKPARPASPTPAALSAIRFTLRPGWERDVTPGTLSLRVPDGDFVFHYGIDPTEAPADREAYLRWLTDEKLMAVTSNRQRGAAWYLEGTDMAGHAMFRLVIMYDGRPYHCGGSLHRQSGAPLRKQIILQAKDICESMQP